MNDAVTITLIVPGLLALIVISLVTRRPNSRAEVR
jgi:hypothetical protein